MCEEDSLEVEDRQRGRKKDCNEEEIMWMRKKISPKKMSPKEMSLKKMRTVDVQDTPCGKRKRKDLKKCFMILSQIHPYDQLYRKGTSQD